MLTKHTQSLPYLFKNEYDSIKKFHSEKNKNLYNCKSIKNSNEYVIKQYIVEDKEEYLELENLLPFLTKIEMVESSKLVKYYQFHNRNITSNIHEICQVSEKCHSTLDKDLNILGKKKIFCLDNVIDIIQDCMDGIKACHNSQLLYLGLQPKNIVYTKNRKYKINDIIFNSVYLGNILSKLQSRKLDRPENFPEMAGKYEFTKLTVHDGGFLMTTTSTTKPNFDKSEFDQNEKHNPYIAPEVLFDERFNALIFNEEFSKADVFSIGILLIELVYRLHEEDFRKFHKFNITRDGEKRKKMIYDMIMVFEKEPETKDLITLLLTMIEWNFEERHLLNKVMQDQSILLTGSKEQKKGETMRFYNTMQKEMAPTKNGFLKPSLIRPHLKINDINDLIKANLKNDENIKEVELFFWNKHIKDKELITISKGLKAISQIEYLRADFGNYPEITNYGLSYFLETLQKFNLKHFSFSVGTSEVHTTRNINDKMIIELIKCQKQMKTLKQLALNFQNRVSITNESALVMIDVFPEFRNLEEFSLIIKGTMIDDLLVYKLSEALDDRLNLSNKVIVA